MMDVEGLLWASIEGDGEAATRALKRISDGDLAKAAVGGWRMWVAAINVLPPHMAQQVMAELKETEQLEGVDDVDRVVDSGGVVGDRGGPVGDGAGLVGPDLAQFGTVVKGVEALNAIRQVGLVGLEAPNDKVEN